MTGEGQDLWASQSLNVGDTGIAGLTIDDAAGRADERQRGVQKRVWRHEQASRNAR